MKIVFTESQIATFTEAERELFNSLKEKAKATIEVENDGFDVKAYLEKRKQKESEEDEYRKFMEDSINGKPVTQYF